uniref:AlNc14C432G11593 protein n=1 Tax=Albugo laibachii Nc14 TaxID=890382 RepID=F0WZK2_9STRA|nr:AlNc14C432G11593 [Albugo laibachii Nc14]|eukprot:CCA26926.1 AlNc14C432G11593 [Albugo laibachii Nc14]
MFLGVSDGNQYPPFYVLKTPPSENSDTAERSATSRYGFGVRLWKDIKVLSESSGAQIYGNRCGWWNSALSIEFLDYRFAARDSAEPVLLLWDAFSAHWTEEVAQHAGDLNVFLLKVPPGLTSVFQPADVAWFGPLKRSIRGKWVQFVVQQLKDHDAKDDQAPFRLLAPSRSDAVNWACKSWQQLGPRIVKSGFKQRTIPDNIPELHQDELVELLQIHLVIDETISEANDVIVDAVW